MSDVVIRVENLTKEYRLGVINHGTLYQDLQSWWARMRGKEDPNSLISSHQGCDPINDNPHMLALNDVSFDVKEGEILGIIGRNGAGKSTLLKILSRVTAPTSGSVKIKGRVASLLEVGTGFHPELTGRENIYLNGAILGMTKKEISSKFDEIVDFAEIEKFVDTPVKRYSSGMYVRLAFAVAAHLEPEILVVDEVLAVGDIEFQKKCLGKMGEVAKGGRTVLFVSHNMGAIRGLCSRALLIESGSISHSGDIVEVLDKYHVSTPSMGAVVSSEELEKKVNIHSPGNEVYFKCDEVSVLDKNGKSNAVFKSDEEIEISVKYTCFKPVPKLNIVVEITNEDDLTIVRTESLDIVANEAFHSKKAGKYQATCILPKDLFGEKRFFLNVTMIYHGTYHLGFKKILSFNVEFKGYNFSTLSISSRAGSYIRPLLDWRTANVCS